MSESEAAWYGTLRANKSFPRRSPVADALEQYHAFLLDQLCAFLLRGDYARLVQLLLLLPQVSAAERGGLLNDLSTFLRSDAALAAHLAHQCSVIQRTLLLSVLPGSTPQNEHLQKRCRTNR